MDIAGQKAEMRAAMRAYCKGMSAAERARLSKAACEALVRLPTFQSADCILAYMAMPHECDPASAVYAAWKGGKKVAFPVCEEDYGLSVYLPAGADAFVRGKYGIMEPDRRRSVRLSPKQIDCAIVPGLAFDETGARLGQGAGYYDRFLRECGAYLIGLAFPGQLVERVPVLKHDRAVDAVITAQGCTFLKET